MHRKHKGNQKQRENNKKVVEKKRKRGERRESKEPCQKTATYKW